MFAPFGGCLLIANPVEDVMAADCIPTVAPSSNLSFDFKCTTEQAFTYTNHRGETAERRAIFRWLMWGSTKYHPEPQWLLLAWDRTKQDWRTFALNGIHTPEKEPCS